LITFKLTKKT